MSGMIDGFLRQVLESRPDIRQVVLFGKHIDTRPFRPLFPTGTVVYDVAPEEVLAYKKERLKVRARGHESRRHLLTRTPPHWRPCDWPQPSHPHVLTRSAAIANFQDVRMTAGCMRVPVPAIEGEDLEALGRRLTSRAFQGSKTSAWLLHDMSLYCPTLEDATEVFEFVSNQLALESVLLGSTSGSVEAAALKEMLAGCMLHGEVVDVPEAPGTVLFSAIQTRRSEAETALYHDHVEAMESIDEDYFDNFS